MTIVADIYTKIHTRLQPVVETHRCVHIRNGSLPRANKNRWRGAMWCASELTNAAVVLREHDSCWRQARSG